MIPNRCQYSENIKQQKQTRIEIPLEENQPTSKIYIQDTQVIVLWDTGATDCYIDLDMVAKLDLKKISHKQPINLRMFDGSPSKAGPIQEYVETTLPLNLQSQAIIAKLNITKLSGADIVIGF
ncbi:hypothetical protein BCR39DRAFT_474205, partial [Naematelia encephala]